MKELTTEKKLQFKDLADYIVVYGSFGTIMWFTLPSFSDWLFWLIAALILHFCLASRLHFELKLRRKRAMKKYYTGLKEVNK